MIRGRHPGDFRVRVERLDPQQYEVVRRRRLRPPLNPPAALILAFAVLIAVGTVLLALPLSSRSGEWTPVVDALFTATSAACVTGLVVVDTGTYWSAFGQAVILALVQAGGFGIMAGSTLLLSLVIGRRSTLRDRLVTQVSIGGLELGGLTRLVRRLAVFTLVVEGTGALVLAVAFTLDGSAGGVGDPLGVWWGVFHAVSAFNNAGFDLVGGYRSLIPYSHDPLVLLTTAGLFLAGAASYTVIEDLVRERRFARLTLDTKIVLVTTAGLLALGTLAFGLVRWRAWEPAWADRLRHAAGEAGWRASSTWAEFTDFVRFGR